ncbi:copper resistance CopC family protein [Cryobacterium sp. MLB-32]|uniref:copper resistance CopC family protein n=1 Tax=Cryobacterium sp. MLB-32 TaxID=1529318 RepID=UPI00068D61C1|nr:copper resistance CopC family protein [Cryobacterium sp. MLB-32]
MNTALRRTWGMAMAVPLAAFIALGMGVPAASAHDSVVSTTPGNAEQLTSAPTEVSVLFTDDVLDLGAILLVVDEQGTDWASGQPVIEGTTAAQPVSSDMPDGDYQVRWRVVSADGHPISGSFDFAVGNTDGVFTAASTDASSPSPAPTIGSVADSTPAMPLALTGTVGALIGLGIFVLVLFLLRRPRAQTTTRTPATSKTGTVDTRSDTIE